VTRSDPSVGGIPPRRERVTATGKHQVKTSNTSSPTRAGLLITTAILLTPLMSMASAAPIWNAKLPSVDLGALAATTQLTVSVWLTAHDQPAFDEAVHQRLTPGDAEYHHWMTPTEVAAYAATDEDVDALSAELQAAGLRIVRRESDNSMIRISGSADAIERAFGTTLHNFRHGEETYFRATSEPRFAGAHAGLIAGITGLTNAHMSPFVLPQIDPTTGRARGGTALTKLTAAPSAVTQCFSASKTYKLTRPGEGGATHGKWTGPSYSAPPNNVCAYNASQIASHYGLPAAYAQGLNGDGQTIVLIDAYGSPTIESDANNFSTIMGLPALNSSNFQIVYPDGQSQQNPYPTGWPVEISLDVEWAHAIAPNANIVLVVAKTDTDTEMASVLHYAIKHQLGTVISNSYGYPESEFGAATAQAFNHVIEKAAAQGVNVDVSAGDSGDLGLGTPVGAASIPADSPYATAIGGTSLNVPSDNGPVESVWGITATYLADQNTVSVPADFLGFQQGSGGWRERVSAQARLAICAAWQRPATARRGGRRRSADRCDHHNAKLHGLGIDRGSDWRHQPFQPGDFGHLGAGARSGECQFGPGRADHLHHAGRRVDGYRADRGYGGE
jgi:subtilase family serine protease